MHVDFTESGLQSAYFDTVFEPLKSDIQFHGHNSEREGERGEGGGKKERGERRREGDRGGRER